MDDIGADGAYIAAFHKPTALLPIARHRETLLHLIETTPVTIVVAATGSGKTTQIPQFLEQGGWCSDGKMVAVTQVGKSRLAIMYTICSKLYSLEELRQLVLQPASRRK